LRKLIAARKAKNPEQADQLDAIEQRAMDKMNQKGQEELGGKSSAMRRTNPETGVTEYQSGGLMPKAVQDNLPKIGTTDGQGDNAKVGLKLFNPVGGHTWYITEYDGKDEMFGFATFTGDPADGELGYISLKELQDIKLMGGALGIERDIHWNPNMTLGDVKAGRNSPAGSGGQIEGMKKPETGGYKLPTEALDRLEGADSGKLKDLMDKHNELLKNEKIGKIAPEAHEAARAEISAIESILAKRAGEKAGGQLTGMEKKPERQGKAPVARGVPADVKKRLLAAKHEDLMATLQQNEQLLAKPNLDEAGRKAVEAQNRFIKKLLTQTWTTPK
jgi:hypothetical protein